MIVSFDPHTQLRTYISPSCRRLYGYEPEEAISMAATEVIHPDDFPAVEAALEGINGSGQGSVTYRARRKDGTYIWVEASLTASRNPASGAVEIVSVVRDVSERVRSEEKLRKAKAEAEAGSRAKSEFLSTVSHELRTPLNAVIGFSEIMQREILGPIGNEKYRSYLADIQSSGRLLLNVINDILDLSKAEAGKLELSETVFDMEGTIRSALKLLRPSIEKAGLCVEVCMPSGLPMLRADERKTQQVFLNLLSNALKFTNPGGHIEVAAWVDVEGGIRVRVTDTGIGIEADRLASVFEPFTQIDSALSRKHNGSGLGLSVVKAIVERHNGSVALRSTVGIGTAVTVIFPPDRVVLD
jgi:PAS domain S-box-containing protein